MHKTIAREKQLKNWRREKKLWLIARTNPEFRDLAADWYKKGRRQPTPSLEALSNSVIPSEVESLTQCEPAV